MSLEKWASTQVSGFGVSQELSDSPSLETNIRTLRLATMGSSGGSYEKSFFCDVLRLAGNPCDGSSVVARIPFSTTFFLRQTRKMKLPQKN